MSQLHELCYLKERPITKDEYLPKLKALLKKGIPSTYTLEDAEAEQKGEQETVQTSTTTPLHIICESIPSDATLEEESAILAMIDELFMNGAGWCLTNKNNETPGCVLERRGLYGTSYWERIVDAGVRAEIVFRKLEQNNIEFLGEKVVKNGAVTEKVADDDINEIPELVQSETIQDMEKEQVRQKEDARKKTQELEDPSKDLNTYLNTKLTYKEGALVTDSRKDGVMMDWEEKLMKAGCDSLFKSIEDPDDVNVLNIGFGMGIIDSMIAEKKPTKHYICEAHPDVLKKMKEDGWMDRENVVVLKGKWQDTLPPLLGQGVFFDGIYYDTYSEHYQDMLELFDLVVGMLKMTGTFSFFNGLGADRLVCYDVYKKVVELDLADYGLRVKYTDIKPPKEALQHKNEQGSVWKDIRRAYWTCPTYYHPEITFAT